MKFKHRRNECRQSHLRCVFLNGVCRHYPQTLQCKHLSQDKYGTKLNRKVECKELDGCVWSGVDNNYRGLCLNVTRCEDINGLSPANSVRKINCNKSPLGCTYFVDEANCVSPTNAPSPMKTPVPTGALNLNCAQLNDEFLGNPDERKYLCQTKSNCVWVANGVGSGTTGLCETASSCEDINLFSEDIRAKLCEESPHNCELVEDKCVSFVPREDMCEKLNDVGIGGFEVRKEECINSEPCVWSGSANSGHGQCVKVQECSDFDKFETQDPDRQALCEASPIGCKYEFEKCLALSVTHAPTTVFESPNECSEYSKATSGSWRERRRKCFAAKDCIWSSGDEEEDDDDEGGKCYSATGCTDFNQLPRRRGFRERACLESRFICTYTERGNRCEDA